MPHTTMDYYEKVKMIGKGAFGKVILAIHKLSGKKVAIKTIHHKFLNDEFSRKKVYQEVYILRKIQHSNIIRLLEVFETKHETMIVMEYASKGDLLNYLKENNVFEEKECKKIFRQIMIAVGHIHARSVVHRDIKLDNILLTETGQVKICDFGVSKILRGPQPIKE